jgi:hypothetical protein
MHALYIIFRLLLLCRRIQTLPSLLQRDNKKTPPPGKRSLGIVLAISPDKGQRCDMSTSTKDELFVIPLSGVHVKPSRKENITSRSILALVTKTTAPADGKILPITAWMNLSKKSKPEKKAADHLEGMPLHKIFSVKKAHIKTGSLYGLRGEEVIFQEDTIVAQKALPVGKSVQNTFFTGNCTVFDKIGMLPETALGHASLLHVRVIGVSVVEGMSCVAARVACYDNTGCVDVVVFNKSSPLLRVKIGSGAIIYGSTQHSQKDDRQVTCVYEKISVSLDSRKYSSYSLLPPCVVDSCSRGPNITQARTITDMLASPSEKTEWMDNVHFSIKAVEGYFAQLYCIPCVKQYGWSYKLSRVDDAWTCKTCMADVQEDNIELRCSPSIEFGLVGVSEDESRVVYKGVINKGQESVVFGRTLDEFRKGSSPLPYKDIEMVGLFAITAGSKGTRIMKIRKV